MIKKSYPASVTWSTFHRNICKYGHSISKIVPIDDEQSQQQTPICPCCNNSIIFEQLPLCYDTSIPSQIKQGQQRHQLTSGICLFFLFIKLCIYYLLLRVLICDGFNIYTSINGQYCTQNPSKCTNYFNSFLSGYNKHTVNDQEALMVLDILSLVFAIVSIILFTFVHRYFQRIHIFLDHVNVTDDDFSLMVENIPSVIRGKNIRNLENFQYKESSLEVSIEEELRIAFREFYEEIQYKKEIYVQNGIFVDQRPPIIVNVSLCYDLSQFQNLNKIEKDLYEDFFVDQLTQKALNSNYQSQMKQIKASIREKYEKIESMSQRQKQKRIQSQQFQAQALGIKRIFTNNFMYRLKGVQSYDTQIIKGVQTEQNMHILKFLNFLSKFDDLTINARQKYLSKDIIKTNHSHFIGKAFITFQNQQSLDMFLEVYEKIPQIFKIDSKQLKISQATQPQDILWQNLKYTKQQRSQSYIFSNLILFMCIGFAFLFSLLTQQWQVSSTKNLQKHTSLPPLSHHLTRHYMQQTNLLLSQQINQQFPPAVLQSTNKSNTLKLTFSVLSDEQISNYFNTAMVVITTIINVLLQMIISKLTELQKYQTKTQKIKVMVKRFVFSKFTNTCIIYFILYMINKQVDILSQNGLMNKVIKLVSLGAAIDISLNVFLPSKTIKFIYYNLRYKNTSYVNTTQQELNQQMAYPQFDFVERYSYYIVQIYLISFYSYLCPVASFLLVPIFIIQYWIDKIHLFKTCTVHNSMGFMLSEEVLKYLQSSVLVFTVGNIFFYQIINVEEQFKFTALNLLTFFISLLYVIFIFTAPYSVRKFVYQTQNQILTKTYSECYKQKMLKSTYQSLNPATSQALKQREISLKRSALQDGLRISYQSYRMFEQFLGIFLPDQIQKYFRWQEKFTKVTDEYHIGDKELFEKCFQIKKQPLNQNDPKQEQ